MGMALKKQETDEDVEVIEVKGMTFTREEIESGSFLEERIYEIAGKIAEDMYFTRYSNYNDIRRLEDGQEIAITILTASEPAIGYRKAIEILSKEGNCLDWLFQNETLPNAREFLESLKEEAEDLEWSWPDEIDADDEDCTLADYIQDAVLEKDDSEPEEALSSHDRAEIAFYFMPRKSAKYHADWQVESCNNYPNYANLAITPSFLEILSSLGFTLGEYRKHSKNKNKQTNPGYKPRNKRDRKLLTLDELQEIIENSCSSHFYIGVYAQVPLLELLKVNAQKPIILSEYSICAVSGSGTFYEIRKKEPIALHPDEGVWTAFGRSGPSDWCGLVNSYFHANISN